MDRRISPFIGQAPLDIDWTEPQVNAMVALGYALRGTFGSETYVDGLLCTPTSPASMQIQIGAGTLTTLATVDNSVFGSIAADGSPLVKGGINRLPTLLPTGSTLAAPSAAGQSIAYLIQASLLEQDVAPIVLPYYNAANPAVPYTGPNNSSATQNTRRTQTVALGLKAGSPASTGSQVAPAADAGWAPLYVVTLAYGDTSIAAGKIAQHPQSPIVPFKLPRCGPSVPRLLVVNASTAFTVPPGVRRYRLKLWGGGGPGGNGNGGAGGGGAAGGYSESAIDVSPGDAITVTTGAAGVPGSSPGGSTTLSVNGTVVATATGGGGGGLGPNGPGSTAFGGGTGTGNNSLGQSGENGASSSAINYGGRGGGAYGYQGGGAQVLAAGSNANGNSGQTGSGGSGGVGTGTGGGGGPGFALLEY